MSERGKVVRVGQMRQIIKLQSYVDTPTGTNQTTNEYTDIAEVWARIEPRTGITSRFNKNTGTGFTHNIYIRYRDDIDSDTMIEYDGDIYRIRNIEDAGDVRKRYLILECEKGFKTDSVNNPNRVYADPNSNEFIS